MGRCPQCGSLLHDNPTHCPKCAADLSPQEEGQEEYGTIDQESEDISKTKEITDSSEEDTDSQDDGDVQADNGYGTVTAPGVGQPGSEDDEEADSPELDDGTITELEEDEEFIPDDEHSSTLIADGFTTESGVDYGTIDGEGSAAEQDEPDEIARTLHFASGQDSDSNSTAADDSSTIASTGTTQEETDASTKFDTIDHLTGAEAASSTQDAPAELPPAAPSNGQATVSASGEKTASPPGSVRRDAPSTDSHKTHVAADSTGNVAFPTPDDEAGTVELPEGDPTSIIQHTVDVDSKESKGSTQVVSGSSPGISRKWQELAGSNKDPMQSLQSEEPQATDSVFERVATRRVVDANIEADVGVDYQIIDKLGEGAMGIVYSARQKSVDRIVAIKTAKPAYQKSDDSRRRFLYEAHITADLDHSNIVPIHELGAYEDGMLFYSMKLVKGTEWNRAIRKKTREQNLDIFMKVADAIAFAHSKGVIHRDLKPENTMLGQFGEVFVTDWGTAVNIDKDTTSLAEPAAQGDKFLTVRDGSGLRVGDSIVLHDGRQSFERLLIHNIDEENPNKLFFKKRLSRDYVPSQKLRILKAMNLAGTPCYMAPEMAGNHLALMGRKSDIYILGGILFDIVTGKAPHTGDSVTQCLRAALKNEFVPTDKDDDPLLKIAYRAMATDPQDRYATVGELQEAVREYRRHAESIALCERSDALVERAIQENDYELFARAMFGYRDAGELWPENQASESGLKKARLAYGKSALAKGDYDLVLQTVDRDVPEEAAIYNKAKSAKQKAAARESTLKLLKRAIAAVVVFAILGLSGLTGWALIERSNAVKLAASEKAAREDAQTAEQAEKQARLDAEIAETQAITARDDAVAAQAAAEEARTAAEKAEENEAEQRKIAEANAIEAQEQTVIAKMERDRAEEQEQIAKNERDKAIAAAAQIQLGEYESSLALAKSQIESFDVTSAIQKLEELKAPETEVFLENDPDFDTWGWQRIKLLSNADLPQAVLNGSAVAVDYAPSANSAVVGTQQGSVLVVRFIDGQLQQTARYDHPQARINDVAISPDGQEVVYAFTTQAAESGVMRWQVDRAEVQAVQASQKRQFQLLRFAPDGQRLIAGINSGIWIWTIEDQWYEAEDPIRREGLRGSLESLQAIDAQTSLLTSRFQDRLLLGLLDHQTGQTTQLQLLSEETSVPSAEFERQLSSAAHLLVGDQVALGLANYQVVLGTLNRDNSTVSGFVELEDKHRAPVTIMEVNGQGQLITANQNEPVAHVWQLEDGMLRYDTYLTGTTANIGGLARLDDAHLLAVDISGRSIVWDVQRQKQRRQLTRNFAGSEQPYLAPVLHVAAAKSDETALAIDSNGVVDLWSLVDGTTQRVDSARWSYVGHTPGVEFVDSAVDVQRGFVITAASLRNAERRYLPDPSHEWEFCIWDLASGQMQKRWTLPNREIGRGKTETIEQRISLLDGGRQILFASDRETRLIQLSTGEESVRLPGFGSYFAVPNPTHPAEVMLVKRTGAVKILDLNNLDSWDNESYREYALADPSDIAMRGIWSEDGERFYLAFSSGGLAAFRWMDGELDLMWASRRFVDDASDTGLLDALSLKSGRIRSHLDVDMQLSPDPRGEVVHLALRLRGVEPTTKLTSVQFPASIVDGRAPRLLQYKLVDDVQWLRSLPNGEVGLSDQFHESLLVDSKRIRSRQRVNELTFVSTDSAQIHTLIDGEERFVSYGRGAMVAATGNSDGTTIYTLNSDGAVWNFTPARETPWRKLPYSLPGAEKLMLSPAGDQLLVVGEQECKLLNPADGLELKSLGEVAAAAWDPQMPARLVICRPGGEVEFAVGAPDDADAAENQAALEKLDLQPGENIVGVQFFRETWKDQARQPELYICVQSENEEQGFVRFVRVRREPIEGIPNQNPAGIRAEISKGSLLKASPTDGILVAGDANGTVSVLFVTPSWDAIPRQLFDLEGHRGARITCVEFSSDGKTIITADSNNRLFGWMSTDPLTRK